MQAAPAQLGGVWGAGMQLPVGPLAIAPVPAVPPLPAQRPAPLRGPALVAQARRGANRRRGAEANGPRIAHQVANLPPDPPPSPHRRFGVAAPLPMGPGVLPAPILQNALPQFHFGLAPPAGLRDGVMLRHQPHYGNDEAAQQQRLREAFELNERLRRNEIAKGARLNEWRNDAIRDAGVRTAPAAPINTMLADERNQLEQRLQHKAALERMQQHQQRLMMYQAQRQGGVGGLVGGGGLPAMGYNAALGIPVVPQGFDGTRQQPRK